MYLHPNRQSVQTKKNVKSAKNISVFHRIVRLMKLILGLNISYSPFCVQAKVIKLVGLKNGGRLSPINLVTFASTQNGE
jgi:hypothetical protein